MTCYPNCTTDCGTCKGRYLPGQRLLDVPAPKSPTPGLTTTALGVLFPGEYEPTRCGVQAGVTPRAMWEGIKALGEGHQLLGVYFHPIH